MRERRPITDNEGRDQSEHEAAIASLGQKSELGDAAENDIKTIR
jgi:hypothetical protein